MARAAAHTVALVAAMPKRTNVTSETTLLQSTSPTDDNRGQDDNEKFTFEQPEMLRNMADRIKSRTRKASLFTQQMAHATSSSPTKPQQPPTSSPAKTVRRRPKRPSRDEISERPAQRHKSLEDDKNPIESTITEPTPPTPRTTPTAPTPEAIRPTNDTEAYLAFAAKVIKALEIRRKPRPKRFGDRQNTTILRLLQTATPATSQEILFLTGAEAADLLAPGVFHNGPILTEGQQPMPLQRIEDFLGEFYDDETRVFVQDPSVAFSSAHNFVREVTIGAVKKRLLQQGKSKGRPWNCLELATHVEDGLRPAFLAGEDCRLLTKLKLENNTATTAAGRRSYPQGYKEVEKWALLAEAGALTEPHQDSHGYSTYITANQGLIGFGWLSYPSASDRATWTSNPSSIPGNAYRYVVLKPGQTVFFPAGTVHFVFRLPAGSGGGHTLAFGGHVLRCSGVLHWVRTLLEEKASPDVTNEDLTSSAVGYLERVKRFVRLAVEKSQKDGDGGTEALDKWGGAEAVGEFLRLKEEFMGE